MSEPFIGEIQMFAGTFAPRNWAFCDGQLLAVSQNDALFSLLGTIYGGDGRTTFGLPDLRGRLPVHMGTGPGLTPRPIGQKTGQENVTLAINHLPSHSHQLKLSSDAADSTERSALTRAQTTEDGYSTAGPNETLASAAMAASGGSQPHTNVQPFLCINFIIALTGIYPSRN
jgi:microcystin-dependent protein